MNTDSYYYHAGTDYGGGQAWSVHTRRSLRAAEAEARRIARAQGGQPIVEWWAREHGLRPRNGDAVAGGRFVT